MFKYSVIKTQGPIMKDLIELVRESKVGEIIINKKTPTRTMWYFSNKTNRFIAPEAGIEISAGRFCWPSLCVLKENGMPKLAISGSKISFSEKLKISAVLRKFSKAMTSNNELGNKKNEFDDFGYHTDVTSHELDYIEYTQTHGN
jgi:hypothetical protein